MTHLLIDVKNGHIFACHVPQMGNEQVQRAAKVNDGGADSGTVVAR